MGDEERLRERSELDQEYIEAGLLDEAFIGVCMQRSCRLRGVRDP